MKFSDTRITGNPRNGCLGQGKAHTLMYYEVVAYSDWYKVKWGCGLQLFAWQFRKGRLPCQIIWAPNHPSNAICCSLDTDKSPSLQPVKFLQNLLRGIPQFLRQILSPRILARIFQDTIWHQILPFIFVTLFEDLARRRCPRGRISAVVRGNEEEREAPVDQSTKDQ